MGDYQDRANKILQQINELAAISEVPGMVTRTYGTDAFIAAGQKVLNWMQAAGLETRTDNIGNARGRLNNNKAGSKTLIIASHIDTVVNAGKFDGPLGILMGLDMIRQLVENRTVAPFNIELIAFCDEEGVRFHTTYLGSKVLAGSIKQDLLDKKDREGISLETAMQRLGGNPRQLYRDALAKEELLGYFEIHIEQGPVLYTSGIPVAVVTAIAGQKRAELIFTGEAGHAGTVPMNMRRDALCCAAECITAVEDFAANAANGIVATIGMLDVPNGASNVIPGQVICTLDARSANASALATGCDQLHTKITEICRQRNISFTWNSIQESAPVICDTRMTETLKASVVAAGHELVELVSGAGHDAVAVSAIGPVCMLFVRCFKGISHNPLEDVEAVDIAAALEVADNFMLNLITMFNN